VKIIKKTFPNKKHKHSPRPVRKVKIHHV